MKLKSFNQFQPAVRVEDRSDINGQPVFHYYMQHGLTQDIHFPHTCNTVEDCYEWYKKHHEYYDTFIPPTSFLLQQ